jgi:hypothetical protein
MNLPEGTLGSWSKLCHQFKSNFESTYTRPGNETDLHAIQQCPGESLRSFVQRFSQVRNIIPRISNASVVVAFCQGVRDEKMLEKLTTHDIQDVSTLFSLVHKCAKAPEGHAWHSPVTQVAKGWSKPNAGTQAQGGGNGNNNKKKKADGNQSLAGAPTAIAAATAVGAMGVQAATNATASRPTATMIAQSAWCTTPPAIACWSAGRSRSSWNNSTKRCNNRAFPPAGGQTESQPAGGERRRDGVPGCQEGIEGHLWPL